MKKTIKTLLQAATVYCLLLTVNCKAQTFPYGINYQAVARDANGNAKQYPGGVPLRFTIYKTTATGTLVWQETQTSLPTNTMGQFNVVIGNGVQQPASITSFNNINWTNDKYFLLVEIETAVGVYTPMGTAQQFQSVPYALAAPDPTPAGAIIAFGGVSAPPGYIMCKGQAVSRTGIYSKLFIAIGTAYGNGDGSTTFNVPDFRGMFLRGTDSTGINDPNATTRIVSATGGNSGANVGSKQADAFTSHNHSFTNNTLGVSNATNSNGLANGGAGGNPIGIQTSYSGGSTETRPKNIYVNYIIKY